MRRAAFTDICLFSVGWLAGWLASWLANALHGRGMLSQNDVGWDSLCSVAYHQSTPSITIHPPTPLGFVRGPLGII